MMKNVFRYAKSIVLLVFALGLLYMLGPQESGQPGDLVPLPKRKPVPDITIADLQSNVWRLHDHRGEVVLLNFWATWCPPCRQETPGLVRLADSYGQKRVAVLGISMDDDDRAAVRNFVTEFKIHYPIALPDEHFALTGSVQALPTTLLIDRKGRLAKTYTGAVSENTFRADIESLLREQAD